MHMGDRIKQRRVALRMSQTELAARSGIRRATISELESGKQIGMTVDTARRLARVLGCSIDYLADTWGEEEPEEEEESSRRVA
jgi:transcriptional regulator with XRE-family HTH domain